MHCNAMQCNAIHIYIHTHGSYDLNGYQTRQIASVGIDWNNVDTDNEDYNHDIMKQAKCAFGQPEMRTQTTARW